MPVAYTTKQTTIPESYDPSDLFADVGLDNASEYTKRQVYCALNLDSVAHLMGAVRGACARDVS